MTAALTTAPTVAASVSTPPLNSVPPGTRVLALNLNPLHWLGTAASAAVGDVWQAAMTGLWSAALWLLKLAFTVIDTFTVPTLSGDGPLSVILPTTLWVGATLAVIVMFTQLFVALLRRDGQSLGRVLVGLGQFGVAWVGYLGIAAGLVAAAAGLEQAILRRMLHVQVLADVDLTAGWPTKITDATAATVLGVLALLLVIPAAFAYLLIMFVRSAALIILIATAPISVAGLIGETTRAWFWKTLRWFFACLLISPLVALVLGIGVQLGRGVITAPGATTLSAAQSVGEAVVGCAVVAIGAVCPLILFRLLAFVDPGTASGAALRQSWSDAGGMTGLLGRPAEGAAPSGAAAQQGSDGRAQGESAAEQTTGSRLSSALGLAGQAFQRGTSLATGFAHRAADAASDVLGESGVGSPGYALTPTDQRLSRTRRDGGGFGQNGSRGDSSGSDDADGSAPPSPMPPDPLPTPPGPQPVPGPPLTVPSSAGSGVAGGDAAAAAGAAAL